MEEDVIEFLEEAADKNGMVHKDKFQGIAEGLNEQAKAYAKGLMTYLNERPELMPLGIHVIWDKYMEHVNSVARQMSEQLMKKFTEQ